MSEPREEAEKLIAFLQRNKEERGVMADLRCGWSPAKEHRAWPHIANYCPLDNDFKRTIVQTVAAGFATQPKKADKGNLGTTIRQMVGKEGLASFEGRFRRLLTCPDTIELCKLVPGIIRAAKAKDVAINYATLYCDLIYWNGGRAKVEWAEAYWGTTGGGE